MSEATWIGVDLDGTLAVYDGWKGEDHIGEPIALMVDRVRYWLEEGQRVKVFTARACHEGRSEARRERNIELVGLWCLLNIGMALEVTAEKDFHMVELWDDRAIRVKCNTGEIVQAGEAAAL